MLVDWIICNRWKFILPAGARQAKQAGSMVTSNFPLQINLTEQMTRFNQKGLRDNSEGPVLRILASNAGISSL
jgi:hypothetical protein